ncbi:MAG: 8-oxo-dGTP diphosphatase MutT [Granulosicoccus sp.]
MKVVDVVAGIVFDHACSQVLLALRKPGQHQGNLWEFPGGKIEIGEQPEQALRRELQEETDISVIECQPNRTIEHRYSDKHVRLHFYDVFEFSGEPRGMEGQELRWVRLRELENMPFPDANQSIVDDLLESARSGRLRRPGRDSID